MRWLIVFAVVLCAIPLVACINDRDSRRVQREAKPDDPMQGLPPIPQVLGGRFDRYPPQYFEMRRDRVEQEIAADSKNYALYDDLAVSYDRLGDDTTAIAWMEKKLAVLEATRNESDPEWKEHWYSYFANQGTFYAHRWFKGGADRADMSDLLKGKDLIARAIEIKPDAHFGRERYQHMAMTWIAGAPEYQEDHLPNLLGLTNDEITGAAGADVLKAKGLQDAVQGISGLMVLGAAWESVDATYALGLALKMTGDEANAYVALLRCEELIGKGGKSLVAGAPTGPALLTVLRTKLLVPTDASRKNAIELKYGIERDLAERWQKGRLEKMNDLMAAGRHPDTDDKFWDEVNGVSQPTPPEAAAKGSMAWLWIGLAAFVALGIGGASFTMMRSRSRSRKQPAPVLPSQIAKAKADSYTA